MSSGNSYLSLLVEKKYAAFLSGRLLLYKTKSANPFVVSFRCPYCGDSQKSTTKTRGFLYEDRKDHCLKFKCHNGCKGKYFSNFLRDQDALLHREYLAEIFAENNSGRSRRRSSGVQGTTGSSVVEATESLTSEPIPHLSRIRRVDSLREDHPARVYCSERQIEDLTRLYYTPKFCQWTNSMVKGKLDESMEEPRLIIPLLRPDGTMFGYQGRSFKKNAGALRYITIILSTNHLKVFGMDRVNLNSKVYVVEGPIDSLMLPNAIAACHSDLTSVDSLLIRNNTVYIPDRDLRNAQLMKQVEKMISMGKHVCLLPHDFPGKDLNAAVCDGLSKEKLKQIIDDHTFSGPRLQLEYQLWNKV